MSARDRLVAIAIALVWIALAGATDFLAHAVFDTAEKPPSIARLQEMSDYDDIEHAAPRRRAVIVLIDGMRRDEADQLRSIQALRASSVEARVELDLPTLSQPYYHAFFTGVPQRGSGVRLNREGRRARLDSLADRVRAHGGRVEWVSDDISWMAPMFDAPADGHHENEDALSEEVAAVLPSVREPDGPTLLVIHYLAVDATAHAGGIHSDAHRAALAEANAIIGQADVATRGQGDVVLMVVADHGHIERGGHGGDEPEVAIAPLFFRAPAVQTSRVEKPLRVEQLAPTIAWWLGIGPPLTSSGQVPASLAPEAEPSPNAAARAQMVDRIAFAESATLDEQRLYLMAGAIVIACAALLALARALGPQVRSALAVGPLTYLTIVVVVHRLVWERPFSMSAIDDIDRRGPYLAMLAASGALAACLACVGARFLRRGGDPLRVVVLDGLRAGALVVGTFVWLVVAFAHAAIGGMLGPWSLPAVLFYGPVFTLVTAAGASAPCAIALVVSAVAMPGTRASKSGESGGTQAAL